MTTIQDTDMVTMQVQVPQKTAQRFWNFAKVSIYDLQEALFEDEEWDYTSLVDFGVEWMTKEDFEEYKSRRK